MVLKLSQLRTSDFWPHHGQGLTDTSSMFVGSFFFLSLRMIGRVGGLGRIDRWAKKERKGGEKNGIYCLLSPFTPRTYCTISWPGQFSTYNYLLSSPKKMVFVFSVRFLLCLERWEGVSQGFFLFSLLNLAWKVSVDRLLLLLWVKDMSFLRLPALSGGRGEIGWSGMLIFVFILYKKKEC